MESYLEVCCRTPTVMTFGIGGVITGAWICEWKDVLQFVPLYNLKYDHQTPK